MIRKQMKQMDPEKDYLSDKLPAPKLVTLESDWVKAEIERVVQNNQQRQQDNSMKDDVTMMESEYTVVEEPVQRTVQAFEKAIDQATVNLET